MRSEFWRMVDGGGTAVTGRSDIGAGGGALRRMAGGALERSEPGGGGGTLEFA
ncbi:MAG: hypothetical protein HRU17_10985 [Polyangiaceae bacterium]|nr:hypothetical protein [Polyangiaceae bacterium]